MAREKLIFQFRRMSEGLESVGFPVQKHWLGSNDKTLFQTQ